MWFPNLVRRIREVSEAIPEKIWYYTNRLDDLIRDLPFKGWWCPKWVENSDYTHFLIRNPRYSRGPNCRRPNKVP